MVLYLYQSQSIQTPFEKQMKIDNFQRFSLIGKDLLVEFLLMNGSNPNTVQYNERTPLHESARWGE